jgi:cytochrome c oxidase assembly protein subunit 15
MSVAGLVFVMIVVGESPDSPNRPVHHPLGADHRDDPPLNDADWQAAFDLYRDSPQYQQVNRGMSLATSSSSTSGNISTGCWARDRPRLRPAPAVVRVEAAIPRGYGWKLAVLFVLGGLQGAIGWWMVASGLVDQPEVSHVRLAVHLLMALTIFGALIWVALDLRTLARSPVGRPARWVGGIWALSLLAVQMLFGAYVAGWRRAMPSTPGR